MKKTQNSTMRLESCRKCGNELKLKRSCFICTRPVQFQCLRCRTDTDEQIHTNCFMKSFNHQLLRVLAA